MKTRITIAAIAGVLAFSASAAPQTFDFKDPKGVNNAVFKLDAPLEAINGSASGISGTVTYDAANPGATKGKIVIAADTLQLPNPMMKEHLQSGQWLDVKQFPTITFEAKKLENVKADSGNCTASASGTLTIHGVSKEVTVPVKLTYLKDKLKARTHSTDGDLLVIRSNFTVKRSDYGINPKAPEESVSDTIEISLSIAGASPKS